MRVYVTPAQYADLRRRSASTGQAMARLVRSALDEAYSPPPDVDDPAPQPVSPVSDGVRAGTDAGMDAKRYAQAGLVGVRGRIGERAARAIARRTRFSAETLTTLVGAYLVFSRVRSIVKMVQRARRNSA